MKIKPLFSTLFFMVWLFSCVAQTRVLTGTVTDEGTGEPLVGANVLLKGTTLGTVTDLDGKFRLAVPDSVEVVLVISYTGYTNQEATLKPGQKEMAVSLGAAAGVLEEVVVTGARPLVRRADVSSSMSTSRSRRKDRRASRERAAAAPESMAYEYAADDAAGRAMTLAREYSGVSAGSLTAGEVNDFSKWELWQDVAGEDLAEWRRQWAIHPAERYTVQLTTEGGQAVVDVAVRLMGADDQTVWTARTDNTGKAELWAALFTAEGKSQGQYRLVADHGGQSYDLGPASTFRNGLNLEVLPVDCDRQPQVDIAFVVDATGSMGDEIAYLQAELTDVIQRARDTLRDVSLRLGSVFYRDAGDEYLTRKSDFSTDISQTMKFIREQGANGGGDTPEAVDEALRVALEKLSWSEQASARLLFLVLDAPPHQNPEVMTELHRLTLLAATKGIRIIPVVCSGMDKSGEYLMRSLALATNGTYTFLTDHSGIGNPHLEPTTDEYEVEKLNALLARVIYHFGYTEECREELPQVDLTTIDTTLVVVDAGSGDGSNGGNADPLQFSFFPNPTTGPLTVRMEGAIGHLFLADFAGKILERFTVTGPQLALDLGRYPAGTYHLRYLAEEDRWAGGRVVLVRM